MSYELDKYSPQLKKKMDELVSEPRIVGYFSVDEERNYLPNASRLLYYKPRPERNVYLDLNEGIESVVCRSSDEDGRLSHLLTWMKLNYDAAIQSRQIESWMGPKFVCSCGLLTSLLYSPYNRNYGFIVCAAKWKGMIYMSRFRSPEEIQSKAGMSQKYAFWGKKFEQCLLSGDPDKAPNTSKPVVEATEFRCMFQRRFGKHSVLFSAELDGLDSKKKLKDPLPLNDLRFVELKTHRIISNQQQELNLRKFNLSRWWCQSYLTGNHKVVCGFRDEYGIIRSFKTYSLPEMVNLSQEFWDPVRCIKECEKFLNHVADSVVDDCDKTIYKFEKKPYRNGIITEKVSPNSEYAFMEL